MDIGYSENFKLLLNGKSLFTGIFHVSINAAGDHAGRLLFPLIYRFGLNSLFPSINENQKILLDWILHIPDVPAFCVLPGVRLFS